MMSLIRSLESTAVDQRAAAIAPAATTAPASWRRADRRRALVALAALFVAAPLIAQQQTIDIEVTDLADQVLADVSVTVVVVGGADFRLEGTTNKKGKFKGDLGPPGKYLLRLEKAGLAAFEREIDVDPGMKMSGTIKMENEEQHRKGLAIAAFNDGVGAIQKNNVDNALAKFSEAAELDPSLPDAHRMVAALNLEQGKIEPAAAALARYLELRPLDAVVAEVAYQIYRRQGDRPRQQQVAELLLAEGLAEDAAVRVFNEGVEANRAGETEAAHALFTEALTLNPSLAAAHQNLAVIAVRQQAWADAMPHLGHLLELQPKHEAGLRMAFFAYAFLGQRTEAAAIGARWMAVTAKAADEALDEGERLFEGNDFEQSQLLLELILGFAPEHARAHYTLGRIYAAQGKVSDARAQLERFVSLAPDDPEAATATQMLAGL